jgi:hypothetical protein
MAKAKAADSQLFVAKALGINLLQWLLLVLLPKRSALCSNGRTAFAVNCSGGGGGQTETQMLRRIRDVIMNEIL